MGDVEQERDEQNEGDTRVDVLQWILEVSVLRSSSGDESAD